MYFPRVLPLSSKKASRVEIRVGSPMGVKLGLALAEVLWVIPCNRICGTLAMCVIRYRYILLRSAIFNYEFTIANYEISWSFE